MATRSNGLANERVFAGARRVALAFLATTLGACASSYPTAPERAGLDKWDGEPVVTTDKNCATPGCGVRGNAARGSAMAMP